MKIDKITLANFQAFPSEFELPLGGKNLLLYGENGSGKSSIYRALRECKDETLLPAAKKRDWNEDFPNIFIPTYLPSGTLVSVKWKMQNRTTYEWGMAVPVPSSPEIVEIALRAGFLDYRSMMRLSFRQERVELNEIIFSVMVKDLLRFINVPTAAGVPQTLDYFWRTLLEKTAEVKRWGTPSLNKRQPYLTNTNNAISSLIADIITNTRRLLSYFDDKITIDIIPELLSYNPNSDYKHSIQGQKIEFRVDFRGKSVKTYYDFLNEARLSALAISIFLSGVLLSTPTPAPGAPPPLNLLVLDDILIGLELSNRLPLLDILENEFPDSQIILLTHDKVWFEIAREHLKATGKWKFSELYTIETHPGEPSYPVLLGDVNEISVAKKHFENQDLRATAVYARAAFEKRLRNLCQDKNIETPYRKDAKDISADRLWTKFKDWHSNPRNTIFAQVTIREIDAFRSNVLNRLAHDGASSLTKHEVHRALLALEVFCS